MDICNNLRPEDQQPSEMCKLKPQIESSITEEISLGFHYDKHNPYPPAEGEDLNNYTSNFSSYDLYCFRTKFERMLRLAFGNAWSCQFVPKPWKSAMYMFIEIYDGSDFVSITPELKEKIQPMVDLALSIYNKHFILFTSDRNIVYKDTCLPGYWIRTILPSIILPTDIVYITGNDFEATRAFYLDGAIYFSCNPFIDYSTISQELIFWILDSLIELYQKGAVVLNANDDAELINNWNLIESDDGKYYYPNWRNSTFAPQLTEFIYSRMARESSIEIKIGNNNVIRHFVAKKLNGIEGSPAYIFVGNTVRVTVENIDEANRVMRKILSGMDNASGQVVIGNISTSTRLKEMVSYQDIIEGTVYSGLISPIL